MVYGSSEQGDTGIKHDWNIQIRDKGKGVAGDRITPNGMDPNSLPPSNPPLSFAQILSSGHVTRDTHGGKTIEIGITSIEHRVSNTELGGERPKIDGPRSVDSAHVSKLKPLIFVNGVSLACVGAGCALVLAELGASAIACWLFQFFCVFGSGVSSGRRGMLWVLEHSLGAAVLLFWGFACP
ncbi:hypothetical protein U1Q18_029523, partial [Sarracenia purpurea var. burkii]